MLDENRVTSRLLMQLSSCLGFAIALPAFVASCAPPPKPPEEPAKLVTAPIEPKCERLSERCRADRDTRASIPSLDWKITPPNGWSYAQDGRVTVAEGNGEAGPMLAVKTFEPPKSPKDLKNIRIDEIEQLAKSWGVTLSQRNIVDYHLRQDAPDSLDVAGVKLSVWEQEGASRRSARGNVVVVVGDVDGRELVLVAFVPKAETSDAVGDSEAVLNAIQSLEFRARKPKSVERGVEGGPQ